MTIKQIRSNVWQYRDCEIVQHGANDFRYDLEPINGNEGIEGEAPTLEDAQRDIDTEYAMGEDARYCPSEAMDGDHDSAMASAGFGTDEDYGCYDSGSDE